MGFLQARLESIESFPFSYEAIVLDKLHTRSIIDLLKLHLSEQKPLATTDFSTFDRETIRLLLSAFFESKTEVYVLWPCDCVAIRIPYEIFCNYYDDLWYPGADDVLICDAKHKVCIEISHEETASFWEFDK